MKNWIKIFALTAFSTQLYAQKNLTIDEAVSYALENNVNVKKAKIDQTIAQQKVKEYKKSQTKLSSVDFDYLFMHEVNALIDAELVELGEKFYLPTLRDLWKNKVSENVLNAKF